MDQSRQIVPGISITPAGQAIVEPELAEVLFDLALALEEPTNLPVDVEHVLAAVVLAVNQGELDQDSALKENDPSLIKILERHVKTIFADYNGQVGRDD